MADTTCPCDTILEHHLESHLEDLDTKPLLDPRKQRRCQRKYDKLVDKIEVSINKIAMKEHDLSLKALKRLKEVILDIEFIKVNYCWGAVWIQYLLLKMTFDSKYLYVLKS